MSKKLIEVVFPEWAFLSTNDPSNDKCIILHPRSISIIEVLMGENGPFPETDAPAYDFEYVDGFGTVNRYRAELRYCMTLEDPEAIRENILKPASVWFLDYLRSMEEQMFPKGNKGRFSSN